MESNKRMQNVNQWHLSHIRLLWSGCHLADYLERYEGISGGWLLLTWNKYSVQSSCLVPEEQRTAKGASVSASTQPSLIWRVPSITASHWSVRSIHRIGAAQGIEEDKHIHTEKDSFCLFVCFSLLSFLKLKVYMKERKRMFVNDFQQKCENLHIK